jgi:hypothetical protein
MKQGDLLARIAAELGLAPLQWSDIVMVRNVGPLVAKSFLSGDLISNRGFNAALIGRSGAPTHFLKVRPACHEAFRSETEVTLAISSHAATSVLVPPATTFVEGPARVLASDFAPGTCLEVLLARGSVSPWHTAAADAIERAAALWPVLAELDLGGSVGRTGGPEWAKAVDDLRSLGVTPEATREIAAPLAGFAPAPRLQHGDFWPRNVLCAREGWTLLDFENCGEIRLPLYDVFHMVRGCAVAANGAHANWLATWADAGASGRRLGRLVRRLAEGMDYDAIEAALVGYLVDFVSRLHRRGNWRSRLEDRLRELEALPSALRRGALRSALT